MRNPLSRHKCRKSSADKVKYGNGTLLHRLTLHNILCHSYLSQSNRIDIFYVVFQHDWHESTSTWMTKSKQFPNCQAFDMTIRTVFEMIFNCHYGGGGGWCCLTYRCSEEICLSVCQWQVLTLLSLNQLRSSQARSAARPGTERESRPGYGQY